MKISEAICGKSEPCAICLRESEGRENFFGGVGSRLCSKCGRWVCPVHSRQANPDKYAEVICVECDK